ncbi:hypothetical protein CDAR_512181 [Caerostris darwini]|uniref:Uncharacterized protein n=1 Tax=Caerostris darwini TaxID=1538125 RepID=A0AAV4WHU7_9ARAC|nr:hypothetical protein CDAR_512181 [Caerostris darwini]
MNLWLNMLEDITVEARSSPDARFVAYANAKSLGVFVINGAENSAEHPTWAERGEKNRDGDRNSGRFSKEAAPADESTAVRVSELRKSEFLPTS